MQLHLFDDKEGPSPERTRDRSGGVASKPRTESGRAAYRQALFSGVPLLTTRLVREQSFEVAKVFIPYFADKDREECLAALVDTAHTLIGVVRLSVGGLAASIVEPRQVFKAAILANAAAVILLHNHPSGNPEPSREDRRITKQLVSAGKIMGIPVHDHVIIAEDTYMSLAERRLLG